MKASHESTAGRYDRWKKRAFNAQAFLDSAGLARKVVEYRKSERIYTQGEPAGNVLYIQKGGDKAVRCQ